MRRDGLGLAGRGAGGGRGGRSSRRKAANYGRRQHPILPIFRVRVFPLQASLGTPMRLPRTAEARCRPQTRTRTTRTTRRTRTTRAGCALPRSPRPPCSPPPRAQTRTWGRSTARARARGPTRPTTARASASTATASCAGESPTPGSHPSTTTTPTRSTSAPPRRSFQTRSQTLTSGAPPLECLSPPRG